MRSLSSILSISILTSLPLVGHATTIASYDFENGFESTDADTLTIASPVLSQSTGSFSGGIGPRVQPAGASSLATNWSASAERDATNSFFEFSVALEAGTISMSFDSLAFDAFVYDTLGGTTAFDYNLYWSVDGFDSAIGSAVGPSISGGGAQNASSSLSFDLSGLAAQSSDVTFRLDPVFAATGSATNGGGTQRGGAFDNIVLNGSASAASLPDSSNALILLLGSLGILEMVRRNKRA